MRVVICILLTLVLGNNPKRLPEAMGQAVSLEHGCFLQSEFGENYRQAITMGDSIRGELKKMDCPTAKADRLCSIVFPELLRYHMFQDIMEREVLETAYVHFGKAAVDFSVGVMQMKPSFAEALENRVKHSGHLWNKYHHLIRYSSHTAEGQRAERIQRLGKMSWQIQYLLCFYDVVNASLDSNEECKDDDTKLRYLYTAYNHGFECPVNEIRHWEMKRTFPYGTEYSGRQYAYSTISLHYYHHFKTINHEND